MAAVPESYPGPGPLGQTDPKRWRLSSATDGGRHVWHYARDPDSPDARAYEPVWGHDTEQLRAQEQGDEAAYWLGLDLPLPDPAHLEPATTPIHAANKGICRAPLSLICSSGWSC